MNASATIGDTLKKFQRQLAKNGKPIPEVCMVGAKDWRSAERQDTRHDSHGIPRHDRLTRKGGSVPEETALTVQWIRRPL